MKDRNNFSKIKLHKLIFVWGWLAYPLLIFSIFYVGVNINSFLMSFQEWSMLDGYTFLTSDVFYNFRSFWEQLLTSPLLTTALTNSLLLYLIPLIIVTPLQIIFSYILFAKVKGYKIFKALVLLPSIISSFVVVLIFKKFVEGALPSLALQLTGKEFPNLISKYPMQMNIFFMVWSSFSFMLILMPNVMGRIPDQLFESAKIDGMGNMWQELWYIIVPLCWDVISVNLITGFAGILGNSGALVPFYMFSAPQEAYTIGYYFYVNVAAVSSDAGFPVLAAGGLSLSLIMIPLTFLFKYLIERFGPNAQY